MSAESTSTRRPKPSAAILSFVTEYRAEVGTNLAEKVARFLMSFSKKFPYTPVSYGLLTRAVQGLKTTPNDKSTTVDPVRSACSRARKIMLKNYSCSLTVDDGGVRATVNDDDQVSTRVAQSARAAHSRVMSHMAEAKIVRADRIEDPSLRTYFKGTKLWLSGARTRLDKLLPPAKPEGEE